MKRRGSLSVEAVVLILMVAIVTGYVAYEIVNKPSEYAASEQVTIDVTSATVSAFDDDDDGFIERIGIEAYVSNFGADPVTISTVEVVMNSPTYGLVKIVITNTGLTVEYRVEDIDTGGTIFTSTNAVVPRVRVDPGETVQVGVTAYVGDIDLNFNADTTFVRVVGTTPTGRIQTAGTQATVIGD